MMNEEQILNEIERHKKLAEYARKTQNREDLIKHMAFQKAFELVLEV